MTDLIHELPQGPEGTTAGLSNIRKAITEYFGERCPEYAEGCACCDTWAELDRLEAAEKARDEARAALDKIGRRAISTRGEQAYRELPLFVANAVNEVLSPKRSAARALAKEPANG